MTEIRALEIGRERESAKTLLAKQIPDVTRSRIGDDEVDPLPRSVRQHFASLGLSPVPNDVWLGAFTEGRMVGALHGGPQWGQVGVILGAKIDWNAEWLNRYLTRCAHIDEIACRAESRHRGIGSDLLAVFTAAATQAGVRTLTTYASSDEALAFFSRHGWTALPPRTPVPRELAEGLRTCWDEQYNSRGGAYMYRRITPTNDG